MKKLTILLASIFALILPGCGGNGVPVTGISLSSHEESVEIDSFIQLEASVSPSNASNKKITWKSSDESIASVEDGIVFGNAIGNVTITATSVDGGFTDTCAVEVIESGEEVPLIALSMSSSKLKLSINQEASLYEDITFIPSNATDKKLTWTTTNANIASVDQSGKVKGISGGSVTITATSNNGKYASKEVNVLDKWIDYANDDPSARLAIDYTGKEFFKDGIEKVTLLTPIDGDTAHFNGSAGKTIKCRFFGIDTPESTGKVQPWGKKASNYTKNILKEANSNGTIVVSSPRDSYAEPNPDSTGGRYVTLIWVNLTKKNASFEELRLVNLMICQEGLCLTKTDDEYTRYNEVFMKANNQAKLYEKNVHSSERDPDFNYDGDYQDVSLLDLKREVVAFLEDPTHKNEFDNVKVRIQGTIVGYANNTMYIQDYFLTDPDNPSLGGEYAGINIFCGMNVIPDKFQVRNTYIEVCGLAQDSENFGFQITDTQGRWSMSSTPEPTDCKVIFKANENTEEHSLDNQRFITTSSNLSNMSKQKNTEHLFCYTELSDTVTVNYFYINDDNEITLGFTDCEFSAFIPFIYFGDPNDDARRWDKESDFKGKSFYLKGAYCYHKTTSGNIKWQICPSTKDDIKCTDYFN